MATKGRVFTCLSSDIVNHEFGHAVLDGLRPYYYESVGAQTAAFHEFFGDLTAILMAFRNNAFRKIVLKESNGDLDTAQLLAGLAAAVRQGGHDAPYLRSALNKDTMRETCGQARAARAVRGDDRRDVRHSQGGICQASRRTS